MTEEEFQQSVIELGKIYHWRVYHTRDSRKSEPGFPDLILANGVRIVVAELKSDRKGARVSPEQTWWLVAFAGADIETYLWTPVDFNDIHVVLRSTTAPEGIASRVTPAAPQRSSALAVPRAEGGGGSAGRGEGARAGDARACAARPGQRT